MESSGSVCYIQTSDWVFDKNPYPKRIDVAINLIVNIMAIVSIDKANLPLAIKQMVLVTRVV